MLRSVGAVLTLVSVLPRAAGSDVTARFGVALQIGGLPSDPTRIVWERLPLLPSERITVFAGIENVSAFNHHPTIAWHDGLFFAAWSSGARDEDASEQTVRFATSRDGRNWSGAMSLSDGIENKTYTPGGFWIRNGELYALASRRTARGVEPEGDYELFAHQWDSRAAAFVNHARVARNFFPHNAPRLTADGQWLMLGKSRGGAIRVAKGGTESLESWSFARLPGQPAAHDTLWYVLPDGRIAAIEATGRPPDRRLLTLFSGDAGASWGGPVTSNIPDADARLHGLKLSNGYYVLLNNPNPSRYRVPLSLSLSRDGLRYHWMANVRVEQTNKKYSGHAKAPGYQYVRAMEHAGRLWVIYSVNKEDIEMSVIPLAEIERLASTGQTYPAGESGPEIVIDNRDPHFETDRDWPTSTEAPGYQGTDYAYQPAGAHGRAKWTAVAAQPGTYRLYLRWATIGFSTASPMDDIVPVEIGHPGGVDRSSVDQTRYGGHWVYLGTYALRANDALSVTVSAGGDGITVADAVKLVGTAN